ncbi:MAG: glycosyltransferase family 2 protein [Saprospiraceae bacterium]|nr:glycosyltransferase family 2 protein [Candidatus Brachybacter algidus]
MLLSLIVPLYNEEKNLSLFFERSHKVLESLLIPFEIIFINDGSKDESLALVKSFSKNNDSIRFIDLSRNFGHQIAVSAGLDYAKGDIVCIIDADLQDPPELIPVMLDKLKKGYEVVYAKRKTRQGESIFKTWSAKIFYRILSRLTTIEIPLDSGDFRLFDKKVLDVIRQMPEKNKFLRGQIAWAGFEQTYVEYDRDARHAGETGYDFRKMLRLALDGITSFSNAPLKLVTYFGVIVSVFAFIATLFVLYSIYVIKSFVPGWGSLLISILFIGGVQMIAIGIIGEYLSRMNQNLLNRPLYVVREKN